MATYNLGKVTVTPKGEYSPSTDYEALDIVSYNGASYLVLKPVRGVTPAIGEYYMLIAGRGQQGVTGQAATIAVGTVTSLPAGSTPVVTNVGTANDAIFNFQLPQGANGNVSTVDNVSATDGNVPLNAVRYTSQTLSDLQKQQARNNIGATLQGIGAATTPNVAENVSIASSVWESGTTCTITVTGKGIVSTSIIFITPTESAYTNWNKFGVRCTGCGTNTLSFACKYTPNVNLSFDLVAWNG